jgi:hypothetical protein
MSFLRMVPPSNRQAQLLVDAMAEQDVRRLVLADDRQLSGTSLGDRIERLAEPAGIEVVERRRLDTGGDVPDDFGESVGDQRPDAFLFAGAYSGFAVDALRSVHDADQSIRLYGDDELALAPELPQRAGAAATRLQVAAIDPRESADFERRFVAEYGERPAHHAILGYRAMKLVLDAVRVSGKDAASRREVIQQAVDRMRRPLARFARYRVANGRLVRVRPPM